MHIENLKKISISYNAIGKYRDPTVLTFSGGDALLLPFTFCPSKNPKDKSPDLVNVNDSNFKKLIELISDPNLETIDVFIGKASSGALKIIQLFWNMLQSVWHKIRWYVCDHDLEEKLLLLESFGVSRTDPRLFYIKDNVHPCRDGILLIGAVHIELDVAV